MAPLKRLQLGEIHDQPWCPVVLRNGITDFLQYSTNYWDQYTPLLPTICYFLQQAETNRVIDLCSGGSGPWRRLFGTISRAFGESFRIVLTDRYPNLPAFRLAMEDSVGVIEFVDEPVDACAIPTDLTGFRTLFGSFHHFSPDQAKGVLQHAVDSRQAIGIFEMTDRSGPSVLAMLTAPIFVLMHTLKMRPFSWSRLVLTYLVPVIPFVVMVDGVISCLRSYTIDELKELTDSLTGLPFEWEIRQVKSPKSPFPVTYAIGCPKAGDK